MEFIDMNQTKQRLMIREIKMREHKTETKITDKYITQSEKKETFKSFKKILEKIDCPFLCDAMITELEAKRSVLCNLQGEQSKAYKPLLHYPQSLHKAQSQ